MSMTHTPEQALILAAAVVHRRDPGAYADLVVALRGYAEALAFNMVGAPTTELPTAQGMARAAQMLAKTFTEAPMKADRIKELKRG